MCERISDELKGIDLGDHRLNKRSQSTLELLAADAAGSINAACGGWNETLGAYRFFMNSKVEPEKILAPHIEATQLRMQEQPVVLVIQDTTDLNYSHHAPRDAGCLNTESQLGFYDHTYLAVTPERLPLGVLGGEQFDRSVESLGRHQERKRLPIEEKESMRWLTGFRYASQLAATSPETQIVSISDCEADIYDIFMEAEQQPDSAAYIIRAKEPRSTWERNPAAGPAAYCKVLDEVRVSELRTERFLDLPHTPQRAARQARLEVRAAHMTVKPPHARPHLPSVSYNVVLVEEVDGPQDGTDVCWLLITTLPIDTVEEILCVLDYYVARWTIEIYFRVLKTGCRVEEIQLETISRLKNCLAFYKIIAWRVMYLTYLNRECPDVTCTAIFEDCEWKSVWRITTKKKLPKKPPALGDMMKLVAELGGYNNRATEPPPGPQAIWVGIRRMTDFALAWLEFGPEKKEVVYN